MAPWLPMQNRLIPQRFKAAAGCSLEKLKTISLFRYLAKDPLTYGQVCAHQKSFAAAKGEHLLQTGRTRLRQRPKSQHPLCGTIIAPGVWNVPVGQGLLEPKPLPVHFGRFTSSRFSSDGQSAFSE